jgi:alcohol dehydrogenase
MVFPIASFCFAKVPPIYFGAGQLQQLVPVLKSFDSRTILLITGCKSLNASGKLAEMGDLLRNAGIHFDRVICHTEPSTQAVDRICADYRGRGIDAVVAVGGGSVIDLGKAVSAMLPHNNSILDHLEGVGKGIPHSGVKVPFIAIPTTSGTGGEVTKNAVISEVGPDGYKKSLRHDNLVPDGVIVDGTLLTSCPPHVTAACGLDALTQLLEPYLSPTASPLTDAIAFSGLQHIIPNLLLACGEGAEDTAVRESMAYASLCSGIALANAGLGIVHGLASPIGGYFTIPHGVVCGTLMAAALRANWQAIQAREPENKAISKLAKVGQLLTPETGKADAYYIDLLIDTLETWTEQLQIRRLGEYGLQTSDLDKILDGTKNRNNPIQLSRDDIRTFVETRL